MKPLLYVFGAIFLIFSSNLVLAQSSWRVEGKVLDASTGEPLMGATVFQPKDRTGAYTDMDGEFAFSSRREKDTLEVRSVGYETKKIPFGPGNYKLVIRLNPDRVELDEVVITESIPARDLSTSYALSAVEINHSAKSPSSKELKSARMAGKSTYRSDGGGYSAEPEAAAGLLTAGELNDFSKWNLWEDIGSTDLAQYRIAWEMRPVHRYVVQVQTPGGIPVVDAAVKLGNDEGQVFWSARTDNTGKAELWYLPYSKDSASPKPLKILVGHQGVAQVLEKAVPFHEGLNTVTLAVNCEVPHAVDIAFVVDATSSMSDEIAYLQAELQDIINKAKTTLPDKELRLGTVFYRDRGDHYLAQKFPLTRNIKEVNGYIAKQSAAGGGDFPEAVDAGLEMALKELEWSEKAAARILFLVLDAPPHADKVKEMQALATLAAEKGVRIVPVVASGINKSAEYLFRSLALLSNGTYVFLTDDSGIGGSHIKPTTDKWEVETLNELLLRLIFQYTHTIECQQEMAVAKPETLMVLPPDGNSGHSAEGPIHSHEQDFKSDKEWQRQSKDALVSWKYWPNPTPGPLDVEVTGRKEGMLYLSDLSGKLLQRMEIPANGNLHLELGGFPAGTYYLKCQYEDDHWLSGKVVLVK